MKTKPTTKPQLALVENPTSFDLIIPEEVEAKIRHLCSKVHNVEWSGTLFYTVEGSLDDGTFKATCVDICVMDIGTGGFTDFRDTPDIINYRLEHGLLRAGIYEGLVHSHNIMQSFFSGTDTNTLTEEGSDLNHFLSLIVNNAGQYVARITRKLKRKIKAEALITYTESMKYKTFEDATIVIADGAQRQETKTEETEVTCVEYFEMRINKTEVPEPFKELDERLEEITRNKSRARYNSGRENYQSNVGKGYTILNQYGLPYQEPKVPSIVFPKKEESKNENPQDPNQTHLDFVGHEEVEKGFDSPSVLDENDEITEFYMTEKVPFDIIKTLCTQLLTGSILATSKTNINLSDWVRKMDKLYEARFGDLNESYNLYRLKNWIQGFVDAIIGFTVNKDYEDKIAKDYALGDDYDYNDSDAFIHLYACDMITHLEGLPESEVKTLMIEELISLMPKDYAEFTDNR